MPIRYQCIKTFTIENGVFKGKAAFTKGKFYEALASTKQVQLAIQFTNDLNEPHLITPDYIDEYFAQIPQLDIANRNETEAPR